jgi:hypothetical protein
MKAEIYSQSGKLRTIEADSIRSTDMIDKCRGVWVSLKNKDVAFIPDGFAVILIENVDFDAYQESQYFVTR